MSSFHFIPFYFTQHNNTVHVVFFCTEAFRELVTNTGCIYQCQWNAHRVFMLLFFLILPFKKYQFHKRSILHLFVTVCVCLEKGLHSSVGKKGSVWNLFLPVPSLRILLNPVVSSVCCKRRHRLLFSCHGIDTPLVCVWTWEWCALQFL